MATFQDRRKDAADESSSGQHDAIWMEGDDVRLSDNQEENLGWAIPCPDGSKLTIWKANGTSNVWLAESQ